jgi:hypothetical protein
MEILAKDMFADIRANGRVYTDEQGENRQRRKSLVGSNPTPSASESSVFGILLLSA